MARSLLRVNYAKKTDEVPLEDMDTINLLIKHSGLVRSYALKGMETDVLLDKLLLAKEGETTRWWAIWRDFCTIVGQALSMEEEIRKMQGILVLRDPPDNPNVVWFLIDIAELQRMRVADYPDKLNEIIKFVSARRITIETERIDLILGARALYGRQLVLQRKTIRNLERQMRTLSTLKQCVTALLDSSNEKLLPWLVG